MKETEITTGLMTEERNSIRDYKKVLQNTGQELFIYSYYKKIFKYTIKLLIPVRQQHQKTQQRNCHSISITRNNLQDKKFGRFILKAKQVLPAKSYRMDSLI